MAENIDSDGTDSDPPKLSKEALERVHGIIARSCLRRLREAAQAKRQELILPSDEQRAQAKGGKTNERTSD